MPPRSAVPTALRVAPFTIAEADDAGVTRRQLRGARYRRLGSGIYRWAGLDESPEVLLKAVARRLPGSAAFSGRTAAWLHGLDLPPCDPIEVTIPESNGAGRRAGAYVRRAKLAVEDIVVRRGLPTTTALRTVVDLGGRDPLIEGVVAADLALRAGLVSLDEIQTYVQQHPGAKGIARLRRVVGLAEPKAESAMETRLRVLLAVARLPRPDVQVPIHDDQGRLAGRPDLVYRDQRLAIEYDGANHRDRLVDDNRRQNRLVRAGFRLLRFTAADVYGAPDGIVSQVRQELARHVSAAAHLGTNGRLRNEAQGRSGPSGQTW